MVAQMLPPVFDVPAVVIPRAAVKAPVTSTWTAIVQTSVETVRPARLAK